MYDAFDIREREEFSRICFGAADGSWETATESLDRVIYANVCAPHIIFVGGFAGEMRPASSGAVLFT